jgi:Ring finger domain
MDCAICFEEITQTTGKIELGCLHNFHIRCGVTWFVKQCREKQASSCPLCRHNTTECEQIPNELIPAKILYAHGTRDQVHNLLLQFGGAGISDTHWANMHTYLYSLIEAALVVDRGELDMLMLANGCRRLLTADEWIQVTYNNWYDTSNRATIIIESHAASKISATWRGYRVRRIMLLD